jgi:hypothetical protein
MSPARFAIASTPRTQANAGSCFAPSRVRAGAATRASRATSRSWPKIRCSTSRLTSRSAWYDADGAEEREDREHLWFRVHGQSPGSVDATLLNEPYRVAKLTEGMRGLHSLDLLSDWGVLCPHGRFSPDNVLELERLLGEKSALH